MKYKHTILAIFIAFFGFHSIANASILDQSFIKLLNTKSMSFGTQINYAFKNGFLGSSFNDKGNIDIVSKSKQDISIPGAVKLEQSFSFNGKNSQMNLNVNLNARMFGDTLYILIPNAPFDEFIPDLVPYKNQWIRISREDIEIMALDNPEIRKTYEKIVEANTKPNLLISKLTDFIQKYSPAFTMKKSGSRIVLGKKQDKYTMTLNNTKLTNIIISDLSKEYQNISKKEKAEMAKNVKEMLSSFKFKNGVLYVGQKDKLPYEMSFTIQQLNEKKKVQSTIKFKFTFADFGSHFDEVIAPTDYIPSSVLYINIWKPKMEEAKRKAEQAALKANVSGFMPFAEMVYDSLGSKYGSQVNNGSCSNPTVGSLFNKPIPDNSKGDENYNEGIKNTLEGIIKYSGNETKCYSNPSAYAIQISFKDNIGYFCSDSTGTRKNTTKLITGPVCGD